ncbi:MAG: LysR substrate-binding domain-containing protein [Ottowia sp.]|uniref:LysR substrate-binding domain-containing protein n=1 Tax=Ottowia sp. TaxID=1898956 RepID=UPI0039E4CD06
MDDALQVQFALAAVAQHHLLGIVAAAREVGSSPSTLAKIDDLHADAAGASATVSGTLRVDLPIVYGRSVILPLLARLKAEHPALEFDIRLQDDYVDLTKDGIDVAVRMGAPLRPPDPAAVRQPGLPGSAWGTAHAA